jgi:3-hydroxyisobutyrate dehydrogenase-like beta-hydroxyacid dehydrogenase
MAERVAVVGLGRMGQPIVARLLAAGHQVTVYNRSEAKAAALAGQGASIAASPAAAAAAADMAFTVVANDAALEAVTLGPEGVAEGLAAGGVHVSVSTVAPATAARLAEAHAAKGAALVAAPVFGRPEMAAEGKLIIALSGPEQAKARVLPLLQAYSQRIEDFGVAPAAAKVVKLAGNFLIAAACEAMAEAWTLTEKNGLDRGQLCDFFGSTLFPSRIYQNYGKAIAEHAYRPAGFALALGLKDVRLALQLADQSAVPMPLASLLHDRLLALAAQGLGDLDWTGIGHGVAQDAGLPGAASKLGQAS